MNRGRGRGKPQKSLLQQTQLKIVQTLSTRPYKYEQLRDETRIHRNILRRRLDDLVFEMIVIRNKFWCPPENEFSKYNGVYYILNFAHPKTTEILYLWKIKFSSQNTLEKVQVENKSSTDHEFMDTLREFLPKENIDRIIKKFPNIVIGIENHFRQIKALDPKQEQQREHVIRTLATTLICVANIDKRNGLSPLDTLVIRTQGFEVTHGWFECMWKIMEDAGFLSKYAYNITNLLRTEFNDLLPP
jgi:hypothetical protein